MTDLDAIAAALATRFGAVTSPSGESYRAAVMATTPISYWRLGETAGTVAADEIGANTGTYVNTPTLGAAGLLAGDPNTAATFVKASAERVLVKSGTILSGLTNASIAVWVNTPAMPSYNRALWSERGAGNDIWEFQMEITTGRPRFILRDDANTLNQLVAPSGTYANNGTHLLAMTKAGTTVTFYADGVAFAPQTLTPTDTLTGSGPTWMAGDSVDANLYLDGTLDEPAIWNRALTAAEVLTLYTAGTVDYRGLQLATADLPNQLPPTPCLLVFPDAGKYVTGNGTRTGVHTFTVRFYYDQAVELSTSMAALRRWQDALARQLLGAVQLGGIVDRATVDDYKLGTLTYAGESYEGIEITVSVVTSEAWQAVA